MVHEDFYPSFLNTLSFLLHSSFLAFLNYSQFLEISTISSYAFCKSTASEMPLLLVNAYSAYVNVYMYLSLVILSLHVLSFPLESFWKAGTILFVCIILATEALVHKCGWCQWLCFLPHGEV